VNETWEKYQSSRSEKARLESALRSAIGYGGMIHQFKNYVLRGDSFYLDNIQSNIGAAHLVLNQYRALMVNGAEIIALNDIENVLNAYSDAATRVHDKLIQKNITAEDIDHSVRIDDKPAFRGLDILAQEVFDISKTDNLREMSNGRLVAVLRAHVGYGGVIHHFKNYVLRQEKELVPLFKVSMKKANDIINEYQNRKVTSTERAALRDISQTLSEYDAAFSKAQKLNLSVKEIDDAVRVNDAFALRSFSLLDREVVALTERNAKYVQEDLVHIQSLMENSTLWGFGLAAFFALLALYAIHHLILIPIKATTAEMMALTLDCDDVEISGTGLKNEIGDMARTVLIFQKNIKKLKEAEASVRKLALTDPLTELANRSYFESRLKESIALAKRLKINGALLSIDLDGFKAINDSHGHGAGDYVLKIMAERFSNLSREVDVVARLGGDEFCIIAVGLDENIQIIPMAERIIQETSRPVIYDAQKLQISASVGICFFPTQGDELEILSQKSDVALYQAKERGKNQFVIFDENAKNKLSITQ